MPQHGLKLNCRGFSLVEVMVAMTVFTIGILSVMVMQSTSLTSTTGAERMSSANNIASEEVEQLLHLGYDDPQLVAGVHPTKVVATPQEQYTVIWTVSDDTPMVGTKRLVLTAVNSANVAAITAYHTNAHTYLFSGKDRPVTLTCYLANP